MKSNYFFVFVFIFFLIMLYPFCNVIESYVSCEMPHLALSNDDVHTLKELLSRFVEYSNDNGMDYFLIAGSLLGSERNGGLMPFDDDIDIGVCMKDKPIIERYKNDLYYFEEIWFGYRFKKRDSPLFIDIMMYENKEGIYRIIDGHFPKEYFSEADLFPLKPAFYSGAFLNIPNNHKTYLERCYPGYEHTIKIDCGHHDTECIHEKHGIPKEFKTDYQNSKYLCYTDMARLPTIS